MPNPSHPDCAVLCCDLWVCQDLVYCGNCPGSGDNDEGWECKHRKSGPGASKTIKHRTTWTWIKRITNQIILFLCWPHPREAALSAALRPGLLTDASVTDGCEGDHPRPPVLSRGPSPRLLLSHNLSQPSSPIGPGALLWHQSSHHCVEGMWNMECWCST